MTHKDTLDPLIAESDLQHSSTGLTWQRCYPIIFISGKGCSSTYHMDDSHVFAWQVSGVKTFHCFREPDRYRSVEEVVENRAKFMALSPPDYNPDDLLSYRMGEGDILWNKLLTPHWVVAGDDIAVSVNISHGGVSHNGAFCPREQVLRAYWKEHPEKAWLVDERY